MSSPSRSATGSVADVPGCMTTYLPLDAQSHRAIDAEQFLRASCDYTLKPAKLAAQMRTALQEAGNCLSFRPEPIARDAVVLRSFYAGSASIEVLRDGSEVLYGSNREAQDLVRGGASGALTRITDRTRAIRHRMRKTLAEDLHQPDAICDQFAAAAAELPSPRWGSSVAAAAHVRAASVLMDYGASPMGPARVLLMGALSHLNTFSKVGIDADSAMDWTVDPKPLRARWSRVEVDLSLAATDELLATSRKFADHWGMAMAARITEPRSAEPRP